MLAIVDNGKGAEDIARLLHGARVVKANSITDADAYILSDGAMSKDAEKANINLVKKTRQPVLAIGIGYIYMGAAFGAKIANSGCAKTEKVKIEQRSPILLDLTKMFSVSDGQKVTLASLPQGFGAIATCPKNQFEIIQHGADIENPVEALPLFGVHFNPELGLDGIPILRNFVRFVEVWNKYH